MEKEILEILKRMENRFDSLENRFDSLENKIDKLDDKVESLERRQEETYQIVKALEHSASVNKAEHDKMSNDIAQIMGNVEALRKDVSTVEIVTANNYADIARLKAVK